MECPMPQRNDLSRSLVALDQDSTLIAVVEMSQSTWLVGGVLPGIERQPRKKLEPSPERLLGVLHRWRDEAVGTGCNVTRIAVAFEAGRDGFWLARWLLARGIEAYVIHASSICGAMASRDFAHAVKRRGGIAWARARSGPCQRRHSARCAFAHATNDRNRPKPAIGWHGVRSPPLPTL